ncbi:U7 snRNA-associated Sm-like protein LSm10 [Drosophila guanche]|uniref:Blast:U7 snRNA-associated Sm-like protein LSm10 n=1 Tax=Drosophila guanche TaxID=7266 RepID=A0A3B0JFQ7_DROGU|nr:U7 snRNA-associated Sm-like protein LSm10 [Drosophila guanche]SPP74160.1 blast:U7 snRNA-associated Sm-like protein LSm10 [Drosophila guanche]
MQNFSSQEKYLIANTLNCWPVMLQGHSVLIDLRNETSVAGIIDVADGHMTCELSNVVFIDRNGGQHPFDNFVVRNRMIRQIHIPTDIDVEQELRQAMERGVLRRRRVDGGNTKRTFKQKRAEVRHKETLAMITQQRSDKEQPKE